MYGLSIPTLHCTSLHITAKWFDSPPYLWGNSLVFSRENQPWRRPGLVPAPALGHPRAEHGRRPCTRLVADRRNFPG